MSCGSPHPYNLVCGIGQQQMVELLGYCSFVFHGRFIWVYEVPPCNCGKQRLSFFVTPPQSG